MLEDVSLMNVGTFFITGLSMESLLPEKADTEIMANSDFHQHILKDVLLLH